jgi:uncharacterized membrane protein (UPF0127 family)
LTWVTIRNLSRPSVTPIKARYCETFGCQLRGLMFCDSLDTHEGLILVQEKNSKINAAIHMLGMRFDITAVWVNEQKVVVDVRLAKKWKLAYIPRNPAKYILETHVERLLDFQVGDHVEISG